MPSEVKTDITITNSAAAASIELALGSEDFDIVKRVGPLVVDFGGSFPYDGGTKTIANNEQSIVNQVVKVTHKFGEEATPAENEAVAVAWQAEITARIQTELGTLRTNDSALVGGQPTYTAI